MLSRVKTHVQHMYCCRKRAVFVIMVQCFRMSLSNMPTSTSPSVNIDLPTLKRELPAGTLTLTRKWTWFPVEVICIQHCHTYVTPRQHTTMRLYPQSASGTCQLTHCTVGNALDCPLESTAIQPFFSYYKRDYRCVFKLPALSLSI